MKAKRKEGTVMWPFKKKKKQTTNPKTIVGQTTEMKAIHVESTSDQHDPVATHVHPTIEDGMSEQPSIKHPVEPPVKKQPVETRLKNETEDGTTQQKNKPGRYHVSQNKDDKSEFFKQWRVRKEGSDKTIKYFKTQKEAIGYAEQLADSAGSSIVIHKVDGSWRKQDYSKK